MAAKQILTPMEAAYLPRPSAASFSEILHRANPFLQSDHCFRAAGFRIAARPTTKPLDALWEKEGVIFTHGEVVRRVAVRKLEKAGEQVQAQKAAVSESVRRTM